MSPRRLELELGSLRQLELELGSLLQLELELVSRRRLELGLVSPLVRSMVHHILRQLQLLVLVRQLEQGRFPKLRHQ
ncbi:hypothetical protein EI008_27045 [Escherichia coli]|nr:hypothetical protein [Escherichia coli]